MAGEGGARPLRVGYLWTSGMPRQETDTQQVANSVDALGLAGADVDLVLPARWRTLFSGRGEAMRRAITEFYGVTGAFRVRPFWGVPVSPLELERPVHGLLQTALWGGRYDVIHTRSRSTLWTASHLGRPVVFETYRRLATTAPRFAAVLARASYRRGFLGVVTHSQESADSLASAGVRQERIRVLHNGWDPRSMTPRLERAEARARLGLDPARPLVVYTGNVQRAKGLDSVLALAARTPEVGYVIVGGQPAHLEELRAEIDRRGLANVATPGWFPATELPPWMFAADVLIIPPTAGPLERHGRTVLPMKVFSYLAAGRPILAPDLPDNREVLADGVNARLVPADDTEAAVAALRGLLGDAALAGRLGEGALAAAAGLTWQARGERMLAQYREWIAAP